MSLCMTITGDEGKYDTCSTPSPTQRGSHMVLSPPKCHKYTCIILGVVEKV